MKNKTINDLINELLSLPPHLREADAVVFVDVSREELEKGRKIFHIQYVSDSEGLVVAHGEYKV